MHKTIQKKRAAITSIITAFGLFLAKTIVFIFSGSLAVLGSAFDSFMDTLISSGNFWAIKEASRPPDKNHSFGHGKIEALASLFQAIIIFGSGVFLAIETIRRFFHPKDISQTVPAILVMIVSIVATFFLTKFLTKAAKKTDSIALKVDNIHYATDLWSNAVVIISLVVVYYCKIFWIDSLIGLLLAIYIIYSTFDLFREAFNILTDHELPDEFRLQIIDKIKSHTKVDDFHELRTRRAGSQKFVEFHLVFDEKISLKNAHNIAQKLIDEIENEFDETSVMVHFDTYEDE